MTESLYPSDRGDAITHCSEARAGHKLKVSNAIRVHPRTARMRAFCYTHANFTAICVMEADFLSRCMECRRGLAIRILSVRPYVRPPVCPSNMWIVTKRKKNQSKFLYHTKDHLAFLRKKWLVGRDFFFGSTLD